MARVEGALEQTNERLGSLDRRIDGVERRLDSFEHLSALRFDQVDRRFNWLTGIVVGSWVTMMATQVTTILTIISHR